MTSTAFDGGARDKVVYITCSNPACRRSACVQCWESAAESLEGWSRKKRTSFQMMQHPIFLAFAKRAWRADAAGTEVLQRREGGGGRWTAQCPVCIDVNLLPSLTKNLKKVTELSKIANTGKPNTGV